MAIFGVFPSHAQTTWTGNYFRSSVSRLDRRFWKSFGHGLTLAFLRIRRSWVRRFTLLLREQWMTHLASAGTWLRYFSKYVRNSGNRGVTRVSRPS